MSSEASEVDKKKKKKKSAKKEKADEESRIIRAAKNKVLWKMVNEEAIMTEATRTDVVKSAKNDAMREEQGMALGIKEPQALQKETTRILHDVLMHLKEYIRPHINSTFGIRLDYEEELEKSRELSRPLTREEVRRHRMMKAKEVIEGNDHLREKPEAPIFSAKWFKDVLIEQLFNESPPLWGYVDDKNISKALDNLFALIFSAAAVTTRDYIEGKREKKKVVMEWWRSDFLAGKKLIEEIRGDPQACKELDSLQEWVWRQRVVEF